MGVISSRLKFAISALALLMLPPTVPRAASVAGEATAVERSLAGQLLVASPEIADPRFARTVILIVRHNKDGAFGIIINRPVEERPLANLLDAIGENGTGVEGSVRIYMGGPVQPEIGFVLHSVDYRREDTVEVDEHVAMTSSPEILRDIGRKHGPKRSLIAFGYAGWAPGQLEAELARRDWYTIPEDPKLVFDEDRERVWEMSFARRTMDL